MTRDWRLGVALAALSAVATGCIFGERLIGPTLAVRNDTGQAVVIQLDRSKWLVAAGQSGLLVRLSKSALEKATVDVLDASDCRSLGAVIVDFHEALDQVVVVSSSAAPIARPISASDPRNPDAMPSDDPSLCPGPRDGWSLLVVNRTQIAYELETDSADAGGIPPPPLAVFTIGPGMSGVVVWPSAPNTTAGQFDIIDPATCRLVARLDHPAFGTLVVTIEGGTATIAPGPLPPGASILPGRVPREPRSCASGSP